MGRRTLDQDREFGVVEPDDRGHRAVASGPGCLHQPAPLADEANAVLERDDAGRHEGRVLAHRVTGGERNVGLAHAEGRPTLPNGREIGDRRREEGGLGVLGPFQHFGRSVPGQGGDRLIERGIGGGKDGGGGRGHGDERLPHADRLRALAGEDEGRRGHRDRA